MTIHELAKYNTSSDYEKLADLMQKESIICIVRYRECRDPAQTLYSPCDEGGTWQISSRGIGHVYAFNRAEFIEQCTERNVEFIEPPESAIGNLPSAIERARVVEKLEDALNVPVRCTDGQERMLVLIEEKLLHYKVQISGGSWMQLSGTRRWEAEPFFIGGVILEKEGK